MREVTGPFPDAIESELLLAHLPASVRNKCRRAAHDSYDANAFLRAVVCPQAEGSVEYSYAHSGTAMRVYFNDRVTAEGIEYPTHTTCRSGGPAADAFVAENGMKTERAARSPTGTVLCFERDGKFTFEWTDIPHLIYGVASRQSNQQMALYAWWHEHAGPLVRHDSGMAQMTG
jgi:hypothetical protein